MRDLIVFAIIVAGIGYSFYRPYISVLNWTWLNFMSPHRLGWGFLVSMPVVVVVSGVTILHMIMTKDKAKFHWNFLSILMVLFTLHVCITTFFALNPAGAQEEMSRFLKIMVYIVVIIIMTNSEEKLKWLTLVVGGSFAFYGVKGAIFSILTGGGHRVWGPPGTFIEDNNHLGLALLMCIPLLIYAYQELDKKWMRMAVIGSICACVMSVILTYSRGALVALVVMTGVFIIRSQYRFKAGAGIIVVALIAMPLIPDHWWDRMNTIKSYEEDASALGRINSWNYAFNLANARPLIGGGARAFTPELFLSTSYAPNPEKHHDAHSIYFEILGEQGWVGLLMFLAIFIGAGIHAWVLKAKALELQKPKLALLCECIWYSLLAYGSSGAFLGLGYFNFPYTLVAMLVIIQALLVKHEMEIKSQQKVNNMMAY